MLEESSRLLLDYYGWQLKVKLKVQPRAEHWMGGPEKTDIGHRNLDPGNAPGQHIVQ
jgi:hypothetical protein